MILCTIGVGRILEACTLKSLLSQIITLKIHKQKISKIKKNNQIYHKLKVLFNVSTVMFIGYHMIYYYYRNTTEPVRCINIMMNTSVTNNCGIVCQTPSETMRVSVIWRHLPKKSVKLGWNSSSAGCPELRYKWIIDHHCRRINEINGLTCVYIPFQEGNPCIEFGTFLVKKKFYQIK